MQTTIAPYDPETRSVSVTFDHAGVIHIRTVNACLDGSGVYDADATEERVADVALGVAHKIELGVIQEAVASPEQDAVAPPPMH